MDIWLFLRKNVSDFLVAFGVNSKFVQTWLDTFCQWILFYWVDWVSVLILSLLLHHRVLFKRFFGTNAYRLGEHVLLMTFILLVWLLFCSLFVTNLRTYTISSNFALVKTLIKKVRKTIFSAFFSKKFIGLLNIFCDFKISEINNINVINLASATMPLLIHFFKKGVTVISRVMKTHSSLESYH